MAEVNKDFTLFINRVLKQVHPDAGMAGDSASTMNNLVNITIEKIMVEVNKLMQMTSKKTISSREIQSAVRLVYPGELAKHAVSHGTKAVTKYIATQVSGGVPKGDGTSRSFRAGLQFPVTRTEKLMMSLTCAERKSDSAAVYLTAVVEYTVAEVLELAGNVARDQKRTRIIPRSIKLAIDNDEELQKMFRDTLLSGGVVPNAPIKSKRASVEAAPRKKTKKAPVARASAKPQKKQVKDKAAKPTKAPAKGKKGAAKGKAKA